MESNHRDGPTGHKKISEEINEAGFYSLIVDETKDIEKAEQLSIVIRYVKEKNVHERFLTYVHAEALDAQSLTLDTLLECNILIDRCVCQCYDGASVMSGRCNGVQAKVRKEAPKALYMHCTVHRLNLVLVDSVKSVKAAGDFFCILESLYVFIATSKAHEIFIAQQKKIMPNEPPKELKRLSDTRWSCKYSAILAVQRTYSSIVASLKVRIERNQLKLKESLIKFLSYSLLLAL